jgi:hypothetical protein
VGAGLGPREGGRPLGGEAERTGSGVGDTVRLGFTDDGVSRGREGARGGESDVVADKFALPALYVSKFTPAESKSRDSKGSNPSFSGKAHSRHSSGAARKKLNEMEYATIIGLTETFLEECAIYRHEEFLVPKPFGPSKVHIDIARRCTGVKAMGVEKDVGSFN